MNRLSLIALLATCAAFGWGLNDLRMDVRPAFDGPVEDTSSVTVVLENDGPDARGVLQVSGEGSPVAYPVELPRGSRKRLLTLPDLAWGEIEFELRTNRGCIVRKLPAVRSPNDSMGGAIALVGDESGALAFLRRQQDATKTITTRDAYVKPEDAPGRSGAYRPFTAVVMGPGSERLSDETVDALKTYALGGGTMIFVGGASAPVLEDVRWANVLPGRDWRPVTLTSSALLSNLGGAPLSRPFTILEPRQAAPGAALTRDGSRTLVSAKGYGLGSIVVLGYSPLDPPLNVWDGRARALLPYLRNGAYQRAYAFSASYLHAGEAQNAYPGSTTRGFASGPIPGGSTSDPFNAKLPASGTVFGILAAYFVLVVPVSFLVLRKMKRGELAWVTAPLLSLGFAGALFKSAESLYSASLSTASQGVIVLQQGASDGMFFGTSQLFFPRGGTYDLKLENVDSLAKVRDEANYGFGATNAMEGFNLVDVGTVKAPSVEANNLAFRDMSYRQRIEGADWFAFKALDGRRIRVTNRSPYPFHGRLADGNCLGRDFDLPSGASTDQPLSVGDVVPNGSPLADIDPRNFTRSSGRIALSGSLRGFRPGPQIGQEISNGGNIAVIAFAEERLR